MKRVIHTGEKTASGGVKEGFSKEVYQTGIAGVVKKEPITPASWQITKLATSLKIFRFISFSPLKRRTTSLNLYILFNLKEKARTIFPETAMLFFYARFCQEVPPVLLAEKKSIG